MAITLSSQHLPVEVFDVPLVPIRDVVIFPHTEPVLTFGRPKSVSAVEAAQNYNKTLCLVTQKDASIADPQTTDMFAVGVIVEVQKVLTIEGVIHALVKGIQRVYIQHIDDSGQFWVAKVSRIADTDNQGDEVVAMSKHLTNMFKQAVNLGKSVDLGVFMRLMSGVSETELADQIASVLEIETVAKQAILETPSVQSRLQMITNNLSHEVKVLELEQSIAAKTQKRINRTMREAVLRERRKTIDSELNAIGAEADEDQDPEIAELKKKIKNAKMPKEVRAKADKELKRLSTMSTHNPEAGYLRNYLEWLTDMPWSKLSTDERSLEDAIKILEADHYGLEKVKERIIEHLAVMTLQRQTNRKSKSKKSQVTPTIICFVGPPGVGKTSLGKSIAKALGREFIRVSLGGVRDEAEIRGHRRTYIGAMPGRIIQAIKNAGTKNPVFMLDEIDKLGSDMRGDPSSALLEALDPEQNKEFSDHYLEVPFDLSQVMFIATANMLETIPHALRDRLEIIPFSGYTEDEKYHIAKQYLWTKQLHKHSLDSFNITITDEALKKIINRYTRESGVRELERNLAQICRKLARTFADKTDKTQATIDESDIATYVGPTKFTSQLAETEDDVGIATGLAYTPVGGDILFIEVAVMPGGKGRLTLTGQLGEVMQESAKAAFSYVRTRAPEWGIEPSYLQSIDVHIHVPEGAVPKDGPSAGVAIATALTSALTKIPAAKEVAMTGEITLRGRVTEIGGLKEKLIAAHRAGITTVLIPENNQKDLEEIPQNVRNDLKIIPVKHLDDALPVALRDYHSAIAKRRALSPTSEPHHTSLH